MCTLAAKKINNKFFIFKNRDLTKYIKTKVILETEGVRKLLVTDANGHFEGLNEYGIGIIDATLRPYPRVEYQNSSTYARDILNQKNLDDVIDIIRNKNGSVNSIISDGENTFIIEKTPYDFAITKIEEEGVITNTSIKLNPKNGSSSEKSRRSSERRFQRGQELISDVKNFDDIKKFLSDKQGYPQYSIYKGEESNSPTWCSFAYNLKNKAIYFFNGKPDETDFETYQL